MCPPRPDKPTSSLEERGRGARAQERTAPRRAPTSPGSPDKQPEQHPAPNSSAIWPQAETSEVEPNTKRVQQLPPEPATVEHKNPKSRK